MGRRKEPTSTKASESVVSRLLSKLLRISVCETLESVSDTYHESRVGSLGDIGHMITDAVAVYPWLTNVSSNIMSAKTTPLTEHLMSMPGQAFILKDTAFSSADSLWFAIGDPSDDVLKCLQKEPHRGLTRTFKVGSHDTCHIIAIQISSCQL